MNELFLFQKYGPLHYCL